MYSICRDGFSTPDSYRLDVSFGILTILHITTFKFYSTMALGEAHFVTKKAFLSHFLHLLHSNLLLLYLGTRCLEATECIFSDWGSDVVWLKG